MTNFYYDPVKDLYDKTSFFTVDGIPAVVGTTLVLNAAAASHVGDLYKGNISLKMIMPTIPSTGDVRQFGLSNLSLGAYLLFDITDDVFSVKAKDINGNVTSLVVDFDPAWATVSTTFQIIWTGPQAKFLVNGLQLAKFNDIAVPKTSLSVYFNNENADAMEVVGIDAKDVETYFVRTILTA